LATLGLRADTVLGSCGVGLGLSLAAPPTLHSARLALGVVNTALIDPSRATSVAVAALWGTALSGAILAAFPALPILVAGGLLLAFSRVPWPGQTPGDKDGGAWIGRVLFGWGLVLLATAALGFVAQNFQGKVRLDGLDMGLGPRLAAVTAACALATALSRSPLLITCLAVLTTRFALVELSTGVAAGLGAMVGLAWPALRTLRTGTPDARRVAAAATLYLLVTLASGSLLITYSLPWLGDAASALGDPGLAVALLQLASLTLALAVWAPLAPPALFAIDSIFMEAENDLSIPRHLDASTTGSPVLAHHCAMLEMERLGSVPSKVAATVLREKALSAFKSGQNDAMVQGLEPAIAKYSEAVVRANRGPARFEALRALEACPRAASSIRALYDLVATFPATGLTTHVAGDEHLLSQVRNLQLAALFLLELADPSRPSFDRASAQAQLEAIESHSRALEQWLCQPAFAGVRSPESRAALTDRLVRISAIAREAVEAATDRATAMGQQADQQADQPADTDVALAPAA
jgi:hypothetical protein